uniref:Uncharacterized protein n=1 Tax=Anguilla anguilla TaxID=7936 RepID=A0A0E9VW11_ANGAN
MEDHELPTGGAVLEEEEENVVTENENLSGDSQCNSNKDRLKSENPSGHSKSAQQKGRIPHGIPRDQGCRMVCQKRRPHLSLRNV